MVKKKAGKGRKECLPPFCAACTCIPCVLMLSCLVPALSLPSPAPSPNRLCARACMPCAYICACLPALPCLPPCLSMPLYTYYVSLNTLSLYLVYHVLYCILPCLLCLPALKQCSGVADGGMGGDITGNTYNTTTLYQPANLYLINMKKKNSLLHGQGAGAAGRLEWAGGMAASCTPACTHRLLALTWPVTMAAAGSWPAWHGTCTRTAFGGGSGGDSGDWWSCLLSSHLTSHHLLYLPLT